MNGNLYKPKGIVMAVLQISSSATGIWLKALTRSMVEKILESDSWWFPANVLLGTGRGSCVCWVTGYLRKDTNRHSSCVLNAETKTGHYQTSSQCHWAASLQTPVSLFLSRIGSKRRGRPKTCGTSVLRTYYVWEYLAEQPVVSGQATPSADNDNRYFRLKYALMICLQWKDVGAAGP